MLSALELAERFGAKIVFVSADSPVDEIRLRREKREARRRGIPPTSSWLSPRGITPTCS